MTLGTLFMLGCEGRKENPTPKVTKPTIEIVSTSIRLKTLEICGVAVTNVLEIQPLQSLTITMKLSAAEPLSEYKIDIHNNFDCHSHSRLAASVNWRVSKIVTLSGNNLTVAETLQAPENVTLGNYHFMVKLLDRKGNEAEFVEYNVVIKKP